MRASKHQELLITGTLTLRAHHLLCALSYRAHGYGPDFNARFTDLIASMQRGCALTLTTHADNLCLAKENCGGCELPRQAERDHLALAQLNTLANVQWESPHSLVLSQHNVQALRTAFKQGTIRKACIGCGWASVCSAVARKNFRRTQLAEAL